MGTVIINVQAFYDKILTVKSDKTNPRENTSKQLNSYENIVKPNLHVYYRSTELKSIFIRIFKKIANIERLQKYI